MSLSILSFLPAVDRGWKSMKAECDLPTCHNTQLMRSIPGAKQGIRVGQRWYCCVDCFALAARGPLGELSRRRAMEMPRNPRLSLGLALHTKGFLTAEQLRMVKSLGVRNDEELAASLIRLGLATEKQVVAARAAQWGCPALGQDYVGLTGTMVRSDIPQSILHACSAAPMHYSATGRRILLGFVSRVEYSVLEAIETMTGCRVEPCFITQTELDEQIERIVPMAEYKELVVDDPGTPDKMARTLGRAAVEIGARDAAFTRQKNFVWARLTGKRGKMDVIFRMPHVVEVIEPMEFEMLEEKIVNLK
jgi:hypothetical protein